MQKDRDKSINTKIATVYFSILIGAQIVGILLLLMRPSFVSVLLVGLGVVLFLPVILGVVLVSVVGRVYRRGSSEN